MDDVQFRHRLRQILNLLFFITLGKQLFGANILEHALQFSVNQAMDSAKNHLPTAPVGRASAYVADSIPYYRIMAGNNKYNRLQFLHIPCNSRQLASANRFSVPGMPCSYMASAKRVAWYECKMPDSFQWAKFEAVKHDKKLIQLDLNPITVFSKESISFSISIIVSSGRESAPGIFSFLIFSNFALVNS